MEGILYATLAGENLCSAFAYPFLFEKIEGRENALATLGIISNIKDFTIREIIPLFENIF